MRCLEEAILKNQGRCDGIEISTYYDDESNDNEDTDLVLYQGRLGDYGNYDREHGDANLEGCGYQAINIQWADPDQPSNSCSPWEVTVDKPSSSQFKLSRRTLSEDEKSRAHEALKKIKRIPDVREQFVEPVDQRVYSDYLTRVEVPMDLKFVERRLDANYYSSRFSLVFDVRLVMINCCKYNGENGALQDSARQMVDQFEKEMLSDEERQLYNNLKVTATTLTTETSTESRSSLENLPPPEPSSGDAERRRSLRIRIDVPAHSPTRATRAHPDAEETQVENISSTYARARQPPRRRSAMAEEVAESNGRPRRGHTAPAPARQSSRRESRASLDSLSTLEALPDQRSSTRRSSRGTAVASRTMHSEEESANENPESDSEESDAKPPARRTPRQAARRRAAEDSSEEESEEEVLPTGPSSRSRRASLRHGADNELAPQTRKRKARETASSDESEEEENDEEESEVEESPVRKPAARARNNTRTSRNASSQRHSSRRASAGNKVSYADGSESEFDDHFSEEDDEEDEELVTSPPKRASRKRRKGKLYCHMLVFPSSYDVSNIFIAIS